ncbi:MAG: choice-of-anchor D domain-containing protein [Oscillochloridaceae bacterium umkhey_bin13]
MQHHKPAFRATLALLSFTLLFTLLALPPVTARSSPPPTDQALPTDQLLVRLHASASDTLTTNSVQPLLSRLSRTIATPLHLMRTTASGELVLRLDQLQSQHEVAAMAARLSQDPAVQFAVPDSRLQTTLTPDDPGYASFGWPLQPLGPGRYGINLPAAWMITTGSPNVVVAVLDTGVRLNHSELIGRTPAGNPGYDLLTDSLQAGDGDSRDPNPTDEGDFITAAESAGGRFAGCPVTNSSWHGTHVAGIVGARANNGQGSVGVTWDALLLHVRVLGKCGGYISDIADGIRWAVGEPVFATTTNPNPAQVLNLSLGGQAQCNPVLQSAISSAINQGAVVVVAAGNYNRDVSTTQPANCSGVIAVAATGRSGERAPYSNFGSLVSLAAPGGVRASDGAIYAPLDQGLQRPVGDSYGFYQGTSMAAPHVAGVVALLRSVNPGLSSDEIKRILQVTATPFPPESDCVDRCGAGILNAGAAVEEAARRVRTVTFLSATSSWRAGETVSLPLRLNLAAATPLNLPFQVSHADNPEILLSGSLEVAPGTREAQLSFMLPTLTVGDPAPQLLVQLEAMGQLGLGALASHQVTILPPAQPAIGLTPQTPAFGDQRARTLSASQTVTITNQGDLMLQLDALHLSGPFQRSGGSCPTTLPTILAPASSCTVELGFEPIRAIRSAGSLTITSNAPGSPHQVSLDGRGVTPALGFGPTSFRFAPQLVGSSSPTRAITITNPGTAPLMIEALSVNGPFAYDRGNCPATFPASMAAGNSCTALVSFTPQETGTGTGALQVTTDLPGAIYEVPLSGVGLAPALTLDQSRIHFGSQATATTSVSRSLILSNSGDYPLTLTALELAEPAFGNAEGTCPAVPIQLDPGASCSLSLTFTPSESSSYSGTLLLHSDDPRGPQQVELVGIGTADPAPSAHLDPPTLRFDGPPGPNQPAQAVTLQNQGAATLTVSTLTLDGEAFALDTSTCGELPFMLDPAQACTLSIVLLANDPGVYSGSLRMTSDDGAGERSVVLQAAVLGEEPPPASGRLDLLDIVLNDEVVMINVTVQRESGSGPLVVPYYLIAERPVPDANLIVARGTFVLDPAMEGMTRVFFLDRLVLYGVTALSLVSPDTEGATTPIPPQRRLLPPETYQVYVPLVYVHGS